MIDSNRGFAPRPPQVADSRHREAPQLSPWGCHALKEARFLRVSLSVFLIRVEI